MTSLTFRGPAAWPLAGAGGAMADLWLPSRAYLPDPDDLLLTTVTDANPFLHTRNDLVAFEAAYDLGRIELHAVSGYARNATQARDDCAGEPRLAGCVRGLAPASYRQWSQELRAASKPDAATAWVAGLFLFDGREDTHVYFEAPRIAPLPINDYRARGDEQAWAAFGQATRTLGPRSGLTVGLRYSAETTAVTEIGHGLADPPTEVAVEDAWNAVSWRLGWQFEPVPGSLLYANVATGFKAGGITTERLPDGSFDTYEPETLTAWEIGAKWRAADRRRGASASLFYYDFTDLQVQTVAVISDRVMNVIDNAAQARIEGVDVAIDTELGTDWVLSAAFVWLPEREFVDFVTAEGVSLTGNDLARAPEWSVTASALRRWRLAAGNELSVRLDYSYRSEIFFTKENVANYSQAACGLVDLFVNYASAGDRWYLYAAGRNLLDEAYFDQAFIQSSPGKPRTWELGAGLRY